MQNNMNFERLYAKIRLDAVGENVAEVRKRIPESTKIMAVIKANAYGHGAVEFSEYLEDKVEWYGVATLDEALELRRSGTLKPILILGGTNPAEHEKAIAENITLAVYDLAIAEKLSQKAKVLGKTANIHIKADTGMSRIGFQVCEESADCVKKISELENIKITGMFTHFAIADAKDKSSALSQRDLFDKFVEMCRERGVEIPFLHVNNSAGTMELDRHYSMVRMGIMLYGLYPSEEMDKSFPLKPAMELICHITHVKELEAGRGISYGHTYITDKNMKIATLPCGYADGYPRSLSNKARVLIGGKSCKILGRICMDQMMVDVTHLPDVKAGDEAVLVGKMGEDFISVEELADNAFSFNYEFVCGISRRVPRAYFNEEKYKKTIKYI